MKSPAIITLFLLSYLFIVINCSKDANKAFPSVTAPLRLKMELSHPEKALQSETVTMQPSLHHKEEGLVVIKWFARINGLPQMKTQYMASTGEISRTLSSKYH